LFQQHALDQPGNHHAQDEGHHCQHRHHALRAAGVGFHHVGGGFRFFLGGGDQHGHVLHDTTAQRAAFIDQEVTIFLHLAGIAVLARALELVCHRQQAFLDLGELRIVGVSRRHLLDGFQVNRLLGVDDVEFLVGFGRVGKI